jgi:hypothetical protein
MNLPDPALSPYLALLLLGFLPSEIWRVISVVAARKIDEESELFLFVRSVATVLLVGVVTKIVLLPSQQLAFVPVYARIGAILVAGLGFFASRRSVLTAILAGEATIIFAGWFYN